MAQMVPFLPIFAHFWKFLAKMKMFKIEGYAVRIVGSIDVKNPYLELQGMTISGQASNRYAPNGAPPGPPAGFEKGVYGEKIESFGPKCKCLKSRVMWFAM